jgi:plastocyanin
MSQPPNSSDEGIQPGGRVGPDDIAQRPRAAASRTTYVEPARGPGALWWSLCGLGVLVIAALVSLAVWAANEDDDSDVAGVQSQSVDITDDEGFTAEQAEIDIGDAVELTNTGSEDCALAVDGAPVTVIGPGTTYSWTAAEAGDYTFACDGRPGEMRVTVGR